MWHLLALALLVFLFILWKISHIKNIRPIDKPIDNSNAECNNPVDKLIYQCNKNITELVDLKNDVLTKNNSNTGAHRSDKGDNMSRPLVTKPCGCVLQLIGAPFLIGAVFNYASSQEFTFGIVISGLFGLFLLWIGRQTH